MRSRSRCRIAAAAWGVLGALVLVPAGASAQKAAPSRQECLAHHEKAQQLRKTAALLESRQALRACSDEACPELVRQDCTELLADVERDVPSVSFEVVDNGQDVPVAKVYDNDQLVTDGLKGVPHELDPGVHKFRAEVPGEPPLETTEVIRGSEKNRVIRLEYAPPLPPPALAAPLAPGEPAGLRPVPATTWIFSGLAVAAAGAGATFGVLALNKRNQLTCSPICSNSDVAPVKTMAQVADASFGGAVLFVSVATIFFLARPVVYEKDKGHALQPDVLLARGYGGLRLRGSF